MKKDELTLVKDIRDRFSLPEDIGIGIGDDAAVLNLKRSAILTTDLMIENVHFELSYTSFYHIGFKIVSVNVSDIYAMGGDFKGFLFSVGVPETVSDQDFKDLFDGIEDALKHYGGFLIGGDLSRSKNIVLSGFAVGDAEKPILRKGAQAGDLIFITSYLGLSSAGLNLLNNLSDDEKRFIKSIRDFKNFREYPDRLLKFEGINEILGRHLMPLARKPDKFKHIAKAMMDISDGLLIDLHRLCEENRVGAEIYLDQLPVHPAVTKIADYLNIDPLNPILSGGEDYELLVISDKQDAKEFGLIPVGRIIEEKGIYLIDPQKGKILTKPQGWQHFQ
ncbi:thiamine-phosphate kinase [Thermodesulfovibrio yellowstonii]|uniref:Thiamine-monophosphate kinase n=1 Tax=Thermodesulfovibrio yellowstonii TaxID=28262 RepID=A0A9W6LKL5_9BACT|nr:thiamine-phosphate kinase [Thermodesulfovibrio islandicus]GLI53403.1 thiamine-monophosphate kinase [Thermodesulfovibrio islandicus]